MLRSRLAALVVGGVLLAGCTDSDADPEAEPTQTATTPTASPTDSTTAPDVPAETSTEPDPEKPVRFSAAAAMRTVRHLADDIGPRPATSPRFARAADWVHAMLESLGYEVRRQWFQVPAGNSWGIDVPAGRTSNVIATPAGFDPTEPHRIVGAHLDTVPQAPGAEDNASGVSVVLALAEMAAADPPRLPTVFVAFGAEEPRGDGDALHHFGSRTMVKRLDPAQRRAMVGMVSLDRVGVGSTVPVSAGGLEPPRVREQLLGAADHAHVRAFSDEDNQSSDHWSFDKAGLPAARIGSTPYAGYHSAADVPSVVNPAQVQRVGRLLWAWINS